MTNKLKIILENSASEFRSKVNTEIEYKSITINKLIGSKEITITKDKINRAINLICPKNIDVLRQDVIDYLYRLNGQLTFCSSPKAFRTAWDLRSEVLTPHSANTIVNEGGQIIPKYNDDIYNLQNVRGPILSNNRCLVLAVRHSEGQYDDKINDLGRFEYQTPTDLNGMMRYRWCQFLASKLGISYIILAVIWFKLQVNTGANFVFVLTPTKIIDYEDDLANLGESLSKPLQLQTINREEANAALLRLSALNETDLQIDTRPLLSEALSREWSYENVRSNKKGLKVKRWAIKTGKVCPGTKCMEGKHPHIPFKDLKLEDINFGHIIFQDWSKTFAFILDKVDHPDNLYLTCRRCNSSLGGSFPDNELLKNILQMGTIGDWIRNNESDIRES